MWIRIEKMQTILGLKKGKQFQVQRRLENQNGTWNDFILLT